MSHPWPANITPNGSDNEDHPNTGLVKPYPSSPFNLHFLDGGVPTQQYSIGRWHNVSHASSSHEIQGHDSMDVDEDMDDGPHSSQLPLHSDVPLNNTGRIPTPITSNFSSDVRTANRGVPGEEATSRLKFDRRLPSPISEDESSHNIQTSPMADAQMDTETQIPRNDEPKKYGASRLGIRNLGHVSTGIGEGWGSSSKKLSMGYRSDCEKCRQRVAGHYMHIVS